MNSAATAKDEQEPLYLRGRMLEDQVFIDGLQDLSRSLGLASAAIRRCLAPEELTELAGESVFFQNDMVVAALTPIPYNPRWGGFGGLPHLRRFCQDGREGQSIPGFLAPFLNGYRLLHETVELACTSLGQYLVMVPEGLPDQGLRCQDYRLRPLLGSLAVVAGETLSPPVLTSANTLGYLASERLTSLLAENGERLRPGGHMPIGAYLDRAAIVFEPIAEEQSRSDGFAAALLPHLEEIVTAETPHLRAGEIYLRHRCSADIAYLRQRRGGGKVLYISGLDIDMTVVEGGAEHLVVPWQGYYSPGDDGCRDDLLLPQDDLLLRLRRQQQVTRKEQ